MKYTTEIMNAIRKADKGHGSMTAVRNLFNKVCFNERNHPNGEKAAFEAALSSLIDSGMIWKTYIRTAKLSGPCYGLTETGRKAI